MVKCIYCNESMYDLTHGYGEIRNYHCRCDAHYYKGKWYTKEEWFNWINSEDV